MSTASMAIRLSLVFALLSSCAAAVKAATLRVGPSRSYKHPCSPFNAGAVRDGDIIEIDSVDAKGNPIQYDLRGWSSPGRDLEQCIIDRNNITVRGANGRNPVLNAIEASPNGKGIFAVKGNNFTAEHLTFQGANQGGCGSNCTPIRMEGDTLTVRWCVFRNNNMGLLHTPAQDADAAIGSPGHGGTDLIEHSEFYQNGTGGGQEHNAYINGADKLIFRFNISKCPKVGHLLKSRANESQVLYNLFQDDDTCPGGDGQSSSLLDFPMGGRIYLIGNIIAGGARTQPSPGTISIGGEILSNYRLDPSSKGIYIVNNTILNRNINTLSPDVVFAFPGGPDLDDNGHPIPGSLPLPCRGDYRHDTINGWTRIPYPNGTTWLKEAPVVMNNVIWRYPNLAAWNGGQLDFGEFCEGVPFNGAGGQKLGPPVFGPGSSNTNWTNWYEDSSGATAWKDAGFVNVPAARAGTNWTYDEGPAAAVVAEANSSVLDVRPGAGSPLIDKGVAPGMAAPTIIEDGVVNGRSLRPTLIYSDPANYAVRAVNGALDLGAYEYAPQAPRLVPCRAQGAGRIPGADDGLARAYSPVCRAALQ